MVNTRSDLLYAALAVQRGYLKPDDIVKALDDIGDSADVAFGDQLTRIKLLSTRQKDELDQVVQVYLSDSRGTAQSTLETMDEPAGSEQSDPRDLTTTWNSSPDQLDGMRFVTLRPLDQGGLGKVTVAKDVELDREVALKEILHEAFANPSQVERFISEAKITGALEHPGIVPVYGLEFVRGGKPRYAMRLIRGSSLRQAIDKFFQSGGRESISPANEDFRKLIRALISACNALAYAHNRGVIHRDIKPGNLMLGKFGETLVVDWGLAKVIENVEPADRSEPPMRDSRSDDSEGTSMGSVIGTLAYMSPEQAQGRLDLLDQASDIFSLGATLYAIMTGEAPYRGSQKGQLLQAVQTCDFRDPCDVNAAVPRSLAAICMKSMDRDPHRRYGSALEMAEDLDRWIAGEPVDAHRESLLQRSFRFARKHRTAVASLTVLLVVGLIATVISNLAIREQRNVARSQRDIANGLRIEAERERETAKSLRIVAETEAERADKNSDAALDIVDQFVNRLVNEEWAEIPGFQEERLEMVDLATAECESLLEEDPENDRLRTVVIQLLIRNSNLHRASGEYETAYSRIVKAIEMAQAIPALAKDETRAGLLSDALFAAAHVANSRKGPVAAFELCDRNLSLSASRFEANPKSIRAELGLARAYLQHGEICLELHRGATAEYDAEQAAKLFKRLAERLKGVFAIHAFHCFSHTVQGTAQRQLGKYDAASQSLELAIRVGQMAKERFPKVKDIIDYAEKPKVEQARLLLAQSGTQQAIESLNNSLQVYEGLVELHPDVDSYRRVQAEILTELAAAQMQVDNTDADALNNATKALDILASLQPDEASDSTSEVKFPSGDTNRTHLPTITRALLTRFESASEESWDAKLRSQLGATVSLLEEANPQHELLRDDRVPEAISPD